MKIKLTMLAVTIFGSVIACDGAMAQSKSEQCAAYARDAAASRPTTTGPGRGAARGAAGAAVFGGDAGRGAAAGAIIGGTRRAVQRGRSNQSYYDECMRR